MNANGITLTAGNLGTLITSEFLWIVFIISIIFFAALSAVFLYHWKRYEVSTTHVVLFTSTYFFVTGALLVVMLLALLSFSS